MRANSRPHKPNTAQDDGKVIMNVINLFVARGPKGTDRDYDDDLARREAFIMTHRSNSPT